MLYEVKAEPDCEIYKSACPLLQQFQLYLEMIVFCGLSMCTASTNNSTVWNENILLGIIFGGWGGENSNKKVGLRVNAQKLKMCF